MISIQRLNCKRLSLIWVVSAALIFNAKVFAAAGKADTSKDGNTAAAPADGATEDYDETQFELWITILSISSERNHVKPTLAETALLRRLKEKKPVTNNTFMRMVTAWEVFERPAAFATQPLDNRPYAAFTETQRFIDEALSLAQDNPELSAQLHGKKSLLYNYQKKYDSASQEFSKAMHFLTQVDGMPDAIGDRIVDLALRSAQELYIPAGNKNAAEVTFDYVLDYPFYKARDTKTRSYAKTFYVKAGMGLMALNKGNLKYLQGLTFYRSAMAELKPVLEKAIVEAGGDPTKIDTNNFYPNGVEELDAIPVTN